MEETHDQHTPAARKVTQRHTAERRFFQPNRSSKKQAIAELASRIVDHRYYVTEDVLEHDLSSYPELRLFK